MFGLWFGWGNSVSAHLENHMPIGCHRKHRNTQPFTTMFRYHSDQKKQDNKIKLFKKSLKNPTDSLIKNLRTKFCAQLITQTKTSLE